MQDSPSISRIPNCCELEFLCHAAMSSDDSVIHQSSTVTIKPFVLPASIANPSAVPTTSNGATRPLIKKKRPSPDQLILNILSVACSRVFGQADFAATLQAIKQAFYQRDFNAVFGSPHHLPVYIAQYVPMRALAYYDLFTSLPVIHKILVQQRDCHIASVRVQGRR